MTASPSVDAYDAQMLDFSSDPDVPMNITGSAEFFAEALMDHDGHLAAYSEHASLEVDMEEYIGENGEYEMADETTEYQRPHAEELLDIEVYDASHAPSPLVPPQPLPPSVDVLIDSERPATTTTTYSEHATQPELQGAPEPEVHAVPLDHPATDVSHVDPSASGESISLEAVASDQPVPSDAIDESRPPSSESHEQLGDLPRDDGQLLEVPAPAGADDEAEPPVVGAHTVNAEVAQRDKLEPPTVESALPPADGDAAGVAVQDEKATDQASMTEPEAVDPLYISDEIYIDPPPAVLLSIANDPEPKFALFNSPDVGGDFTEEAPDNRKVHSLLLEDRPTLYYEPLSSVFEALRQDEGFLSRVPHSFEGELVLDAHDLQLVVSEDNVHSREISVHDLNILHDGSDFVGPLRLHLRAIVPRFILRYYALQEQIQRLHVATEIEGEEHREHYDTAEEQPLPPQGEAVEPPPPLAVALSEGSEVPSNTGAEEPVKESPCAPEPTDETPQESYELENGASNEPSAEYHEVIGEATHALEDENDYESTNVGDEDEVTKTDILDADRVHDVAAEDTDAPTTVTGQDSEFGGEQTEYLDGAQLEEYDERYGEELPEGTGGASPVQHGEALHYEEEGEQDTSTAVEETPTILPGSDEYEEDQSAVTPTAARAILEPEARDPIIVNTDIELVPPRQDIPASSSEELLTSESRNKVDNVQAPGSREQKQNTLQANIFSEVEESDSNFVKMLEREADAEFDRTFSAEQNRQEGSIEAILQHDEAWDDWDDEDAEGDDEEDWIDPDADSNESSVTLSSKASSKRNYDEVDPNEEVTVENSQSSPGSKRPRVE